MDAASFVSSSSRRSVGNGLANVRVLAPGAPAYDHVTQALVDEVHRVVRSETEKKRSATQVLFPLALDATVMGEFMAMYPEYRLTPLNSMDTVHSEWVAHRFMAVNLAVDAARTYTSRITLIGDGLYQCATRALRGVHLETDPCDAFGVHSRHSSAQEYVRTSRSRVIIEKNHNYKLSTVCYKDFIMGEAFQTCDNSAKCNHQSDALVIDLSMHPLTVTQACMAVLASGAGFAEAFIPYTADVFRMKEGQFAFSGGVGYKQVDGSLDIMYPSGVAGTTRYSFAVWAEWLKATTITVRDGLKLVDFRLELSQHRGPFMYCRLVKLEGRQKGGVTRHALEMPWADGKYVFTYSKLVSPLANPNLKESWCVQDEFVPQPVIDKLYLYAMGLDQSEFTPEMILRRASKIDARVITHGTNIRVREPLEPGLAMEVAGGVYAKAFVSRYESGKLGTDLIRELQRVNEFTQMSRTRRLAVVFSSVVDSVVPDAVRSWYHSFKALLVRYLSTSRGIVVPNFIQAPKFVLLEEHTSWLLRTKRDAFALVYGGHVSVPSLKGGAAAVLSAKAMGKMSPVELDIGDVVPITEPSGDLHDDIVDTSQGTFPSDDVVKMVKKVAVEDDVTVNNSGRFELRMQFRTPEVKQGHDGPERFDRVADVPGTMNDIAEKIFPGLTQQDFELDGPSMRFDPQHREVHAEYLEHPIDDPVRPSTAKVYKSKILGYNVEKKAQTLQETLTSLSARNLAAPAMRIESDEQSKILSIFDKMKAGVFVENVDELLEVFRRDKVGFEEELLAEWGMKAKPENVKKVLREALLGCSFEDARPWEYDIIMKSDAKPPLSTKPLREVIPPQMIAMNQKHASALMSSIFRVMSRRFVSLLRPEIMANLLKDTDGIRDHIAANHPWGATNLVFLENDFSKFDKSQDRFSYMLMQFFMQVLGFDDELLDRWMDANERCTLRSMSLGILLYTRYQNKSGGPATALMNLVMNMSATVTCYAGTVILWAAFMGDDSIVCCRTLVASQSSLQKMAEDFNFEAKFFVLKYPYFTSCFILFDNDSKKVFMVPDPVKKLQRYSVSVTAASPAWEDKARSANETLVAYRHSGDLTGLDAAVRERYGVRPEVDIVPLFDSLGTLSSSLKDFRSLYDSEITIIPL